MTRLRKDGNPADDTRHFRVATVASAEAGVNVASCLDRLIALEVPLSFLVFRCHCSADDPGEAKTNVGSDGETAEN
jgi:hypothetical protein